MHVVVVVVVEITCWGLSGRSRDGCCAGRRDGDVVVVAEVVVAKVVVLAMVVAVVERARMVVHGMGVIVVSEVSKWPEWPKRP